MTSLKNGALYRVPLNADGKTAQGDVTKYSRQPLPFGAVSPDGKTIYATDVRNVSATTATVNDMKNPG
ncbi:MAG: hypothetical protein ACLU6O_04565 [Bilophila wadsworthia]